VLPTFLFISKAVFLIKIKNKGYGREGWIEPYSSHHGLTPAMQHLASKQVIKINIFYNL
jgi:hypothetical protein